MTTRHRRPYVWVGDLSSPAVEIDGCYRSAQFDRELAACLPFDSALAVDLRHSAHRWFEQAQTVERLWMRRRAVVLHE